MNERSNAPNGGLVDYAIANDVKASFRFVIIPRIGNYECNSRLNGTEIILYSDINIHSIRLVLREKEIISKYHVKLDNFDS